MNINAKALKAMLLFAAKKDIRFYLNGVLIRGEFMVATDGHRMAVYRLPEDSGLNIVIPREDVELGLKSVGKQEWIVVNENYVGRVAYTCLDASTYPDWRKVVPSKIGAMQVSHVAFSTDYISDFSKAYKAMHPHDGHLPPIIVRQESESSVAIVDFGGGENFFVLLMPRRAETAPQIPEWVVHAKQKFNAEQELKKLEEEKNKAAEEVAA